MNNNDKQEQWETKHWVIHNALDNSVDRLIHHPQVQEAARWLKADELIAFPTETVYGLGANALSDAASQKIYKAKGRPSDNPLIVHIACEEQLEGIVDRFTELGKTLSAAFWPGPLTLILPRGTEVCSTVTADLATVAVRMPSHPLALALIRAANLPLAAPSANLSGKPSPTQAVHVLQDLSGRIAGVLDGGATGIGLESTVVDVTREIPMLLRPGGITLEQLQEVVGRVDVDPALSHHLSDEELGQPISPGVKYTHYAPEASVYVVSDQQGLVPMRQKIQEQVKQYQAQGRRVAVLTTEEAKHLYQADLVLSLGERSKLETVAAQLFTSLRQCDQADVDLILVESFSKRGIGAALMNRLEKAAGGKIIKP